MWPYWVLFVLPSLIAVADKPPTGRGMPRAADSLPMFLAFGVLIAFMIGLRFEVGGDWTNYLDDLPRVGEAPLADVLLMSDPAYQLLTWVSFKCGWDIYGVNLMGGALFSAGLIRFCRRLPRPWLALAAAIPYLVIVVGMGYSRQAVALGLSLFALIELARGSNVRFAIWVVLSATFHKTALLLLPIAAFANAKSRFKAVAWVTVAVAIAYPLLLEDSVESLYVNYVETGYQSEGALIRLAMNAVAAAVLLLCRKRFSFSRKEAGLWASFSVISIGLFGAFFLTDASTALDRLALYMLPLQLVVFSHLPNVIGSRGGRNQALVVGVIMYFAAVQFVWLNFATHADFWVPYRMYPFT